jgi:choice-of-anchor B domain-containing protein
MKKFVTIFIIIFFIQNLYAQNIDFLSQINYGRRTSNLWGYTDNDGKEYAIVGVYDGTSIVDLSNPESPEELFFVPGPEGIWREMKTWNNYAYITNETGNGLQIIDLNNLPISVNDTFYTGDSLETAHTIFIDENGYCYLFGANTDNGGATILDLSIDPWNPVKVGAYTGNYIHDGFVRNDTLWAAEIGVGQVEVIDVSNKAFPVLLGQQSTPNQTTHNTWLDNSGGNIFTTDETNGSYVTSYDVSDVTDIKELDRYQKFPGSGSIVHNTYWLDNFLVNAYYTNGVTIVDATNPGNLVETGWFDTSPFSPTAGYNGCWGVYPFFPSGIIIATDIQEGLFVLQPNFQRASYLEGSVTNEVTSTPLFNAKVELLSTEIIDSTNLFGEFKTGYRDEGLYDVRVTAGGCIPEIYPNIQMIEGETYELNATLNCTSTVDVQTIEDKFYFEAFPSVFTDKLFLQWNFNDSEKDAICRIISVSGDIIDQFEITESSGLIALPADFPAGCYIVLMISNNQSESMQIVKIN